jgi:glycosyltransferase involved in cell wall biosynthesis
MPSHAVGRIEDEEHLSLVYAACDVFAFPSREDNAPLTVGESLLSGTPVVAFPIGNVPDLVHHLETGYLARFDDVDDFAAGLAWALSAPRSRQAVTRSMQCRMVARAYHDPETCAARHVAVYEQMIEEAARLARKRPA